MTKAKQLLCPSAECEKGALLLGIVQGTGKVSFFGGNLVVDDEFVSRSKKGRAPEKRFRFSNKCIECSCRQWDHGRCTVIDKVLNQTADETPPQKLPNCGIRANCRWFAQSGVVACGSCELVVTDTREF